MKIWKRYLDWRLRNIASVETSDERFRGRHRRTATEFLWNEVSSVTAFKRDLITLDRLSLLVEFNGSAIELNEDMHGFERWLATLEAHFNLCSEWRIPVLFPAFEANSIQIFCREPSPAPHRDPA